MELHQMWQASSNHRSIHPVDSTGTSAISIESIRGHSTYYIGVTNKVGTTRVTKAGTTGMGVIRKQQREIACKACVNLNQVRASQHANSLIIFLPGSCIW